MCYNQHLLHQVGWEHNFDVCNQSSRVNFCRSHEKKRKREEDGGLNRAGSHQRWWWTARGEGGRQKF